MTFAGQADWLDVAPEEEQLGLQQLQLPSFDSISNYAIDSPIALLELSYGLVLGPFLEDLLRTYFQNIHPYYPVIDEFDFDVSFSESIDDELLRKSRATVLCSMFLCASMVSLETSLALNNSKTITNINSST
jgi:hypothetical protein